jgi:hypothetical protein
MAMQVISVLNVPEPNTNDMPASKVYVDELIDAIQEYADDTYTSLQLTVNNISSLAIPKWNESRTYSKNTIVQYRNKIYVSVLGGSTYYTNYGQYPGGKTEGNVVVNNTYKEKEGDNWVTYTSETPIYWREYNICGVYRGTFSMTESYMPSDIVRDGTTGVLYAVKDTETGGGIRNVALLKNNGTVSDSWEQVISFASNSTYGIVKVDNTTIVANNGVLSVVGGGGGSSSVSVTSGNGISVTGSYTVAVDLATNSGLEFETSTNKLKAKVDGSIVTINSSGEIIVSDAANGQKGVVELGLCTGVTGDEGKVPALDSNGKVPYAALPIQATTTTIGSVSGIPVLNISNGSTVVGVAPLIDEDDDSISYQVLPYASTNEPGIVKPDGHSIKMYNGTSIIRGNGLEVAHLTSITSATGTTNLSADNLKTGLLSIILSKAVTARTLKFPKLTEYNAYTKVQTCEIMIRALKDTTNTSNTSFNLALQYVDDSNVVQSLYLMTGENQIEIERGYTYFFVFRNFPSCLATNATTSYSNSALNKRQWTGSLQGRVPFIT